MARTSAEWWAEIKKSPKKFEQWLQKQYHGEVTAAPRIRALANRQDLMPVEAQTLRLIADQEEQHAAWVAELLKTRGLDPVVIKKRERYWEQTLSSDDTSFSYMCAVAAHAETMRLERIRVIAHDEEAPTDVRDTFKRILQDEEFHARTFRKYAGGQALADAAGRHRKGMAALGLVV